MSNGAGAKQPEPLEDLAGQVARVRDLSNEVRNFVLGIVDELRGSGMVSPVGGQPEHPEPLGRIGDMSECLFAVERNLQLIRSAVIRI